jgi:mannose-6-phosphate isomerase-like protein (cupin superfamily)
MIQSIDCHAIAREARNGYMNRVLTSVNGQNVHLSVMEGPFYWHLHPDSDETFLVLEGALVIDFDDGSVELRLGQLLTVPAGMRHRTRPAGARSVNLTVEKAGANTVRCDEPASN